MPVRVREEGGFGLVELLIALTVTSIGIFALVAGFSSGLTSINRASKASTAGVVADKQMEAFRRFQYSAVALGTTDATTTGPDGRTYFARSEVTLSCVVGSLDTTDPLAPVCPDVDTGKKSRPLKLVTVTVRDGSSTGPVLIRQSTTIDQSTG
jgi:type II secretory pathway pseudopilin PulG